MAVFDAPIHVNDLNWSKFLQQKQPVLLYLFNQTDPQLDEALKQVARTHAGDLLVTRLDIGENPQTYALYGRPTLPALVVIREGQRETAAAIQAPDIAAYSRYALGKGPKPAEKAPPASAATVPVSDQNFRSAVLNSEIPVLVDFWAPWCGPCHRVAPIVEAVARKYAGRLKVAKLNVDESPRTASAYQATSIPTLILFRKGQPAGRLVGAHPQPNIEQMIESALRG